MVYSGLMRFIMSNGNNSKMGSSFVGKPNMLPSLHGNERLRQPWVQHFQRRDTVKLSTSSKVGKSVGDDETT